MASSADTPEATAREFAGRFGRRAFADAAELLTGDGHDRVVESFPDEFRDDPFDAVEALKQYWWGLYSRYGEFEEARTVAAEDGEVTVELDFANGSERATVDVGPSGVVGFSFAPGFEVPDYVDRTAFTERDVTIDAGDVELPGVLAVPDGDGPFPGVLLVHGHGIHDPDGTAGATKILRDLAWGLATEGIASLRYEKRLDEHEVADENYTLDAVVTDDAVAAASTLADVSEVDADSVFVAGHSQGGMCAPRIADRHGDVAGVVNLDGPADPVVDPDDLTFMRYSIELDGELSEAQEEKLAAQRETFRRIADGDFDDDETIMGKPGVWHRSHREYDPVATASSLDAPVFVLSTGRADTEMQPELHEALRDRFTEWQAGDLPDGSRTEFYENLDHYFLAGPTPTAPTAIYFGGTVERGVIADVADWIHGIA